MFILINIHLEPVFDSFSAAQPLHWVYDLQKLQGFLAQDPNPEFRAESANPFYRRQTGEQSCYGDQAFVLLESLSECGGKMVSQTLGCRMMSYTYITHAP